MHSPSKHHLGVAKRVLRKSTSGSVFDFGIVVVYWSSKKQPITALSSAEFVAASSGSCHSMWMRYILAEIYQAQDEVIVIYCDNKATIQMTRNSVYHGRTKHVDIKVNSEEQVILDYLNTNEQATDIFIKTLFTHKHDYFRRCLGWGCSRVIQKAANLE
ncbi:hypothetical protein AgCh_013320 [Apium graveolens]